MAWPEAIRDHAMNSIAALRLVLSPRPYRYLAFGLFAVALTVYLLTLPAGYTGGVIGLIALQYLNAELLFFSVALAALLSLVLTLNVYAFRASVMRSGTGLGLGAVFASLLPSSLCCTPVVPSLLAILGASTPQIFGLSGRIQGIFATYEPVFLAIALALLLVSFRLASRNILGACPVSKGRATTNGPS